LCGWAAVELKAEAFRINQCNKKFLTPALKYLEMKRLGWTIRINDLSDWKYASASIGDLSGFAPT
jgi:hypothetical protein